MRKLILLPLASFSCVFACNRDGSEADVQFAVINEKAVQKDTLLQQIYKNKNVIHVCTINEAPAKNQKWLNAVESGFEQAFKAWHTEGVNHPKFPLPTPVKLDFKRIPSSSYLKMELDSIDMQAKSATGFKSMLDRLMEVSDDGFSQAFTDFQNFLVKLGSENTAPLAGCPQESVKLIAFSDPAVITSFENEIDKKGGLSKSLLTPKQEEDLLRKFVRIMYKGKMTYEEFKRKNELSEKNKDYLTRGHATISPPSITIQQTHDHEEFLNSILMHETGHLFGLGDVYVDRDLQTDLKAHPNAVMGNHYSPEVQGKIQPDDVMGLMASITLSKSAVKECGQGYHEFDNTSDSRSLDNFYCLPDGFEQQNFGLATKKEVVSIPSGSVAPAQPSGNEGSAQGASVPLSCPVNMISSDSSGVCCPVKLPKFDSIKGACVDKK